MGAGVAALASAGDGLAGEDEGGHCEDAPSWRERGGAVVAGGLVLRLEAVAEVLVLLRREP
jgi:hypothetical protein